MRTKDHLTVSIWLSRDDHALLKRVVSAADKQRPEMRYNASLIVRTLLRSYASGECAPGALPAINAKSTKARKPAKRATKPKKAKKPKKRAAKPKAKKAKRSRPSETFRPTEADAKAAVAGVEITTTE